MPLAALVLSVRLSDIGVPQLAEAVVLHLKDAAWAPGLRFGHLEAAANVIVFVPIGYLLAGILGRRSGLRRAGRRGAPDVAVWLMATCFSAAIELAQLFLLAQRSATVRDLICNSAGALAGVLVFRAAQIARQRHRRRRRHDH